MSFSRSAARRTGLAGAPILLIFGILFVYPLLRFLALPWFPALGPIGSMGVAVQGSGLSEAAVLNTLRLGLITAALTTPAGILFAFLLECRAWSGNRALSF